MPINSRQKGARFERQVAKLIQGAGFYARRGQQFSGSPDSPDVVQELPVAQHMECKHVERLNLYTAYKQACKDKGEDEIAVVVSTKNHEPVLCTVAFEDWLDIMKVIQGFLGIHTEQEVP